MDRASVLSQEYKEKAVVARRYNGPSFVFGWFFLKKEKHRLKLVKRWLLAGLCCAILIKNTFIIAVRDLKGEERLKSKKREWRSLLIGIIGAYCGVFCLVTFQNNFLRDIALLPRMVVMIVAYWLIALPALVMMQIDGDRPSDYGFTRKGLWNQILRGIGIGLAMSIVLTLLPHLFGLGDLVDSGKRYTQAWQFCYEFVYCIGAVALTEEFVFRGFVYEKIKRISGKPSVAMVASSVLFGGLHFMGGNIIQIITATLLGMFFCRLRTRGKNGALLVVILAHGVHNAMITVWAAVFLRLS